MRRLLSGLAFSLFIITTVAAQGNGSGYGYENNGSGLHEQGSGCRNKLVNGNEGHVAASYANSYVTSSHTCQASSHAGESRRLPTLPRPITADEHNLDALKEIMGQKGLALENGIAASKTNGIDPPIGVNFGANQTITGTPPDNSIAISNAGLIISADNNMLDYFNENGDSLLRVRLDTLLKDTVFSLAPFDPMVEYDFERDRFYLVFGHGFASPVSKLVLLISKTNDPRNGWWEYAIPAIDSINHGIWMDYPVLGHNRENIFVSTMMLQDSTDAFVGNQIMKFDIASGLNGGNLSYQTFYNVKDGNGAVPRVIIPASLGQSGNYSKEMYFVSSEATGGDQVHLYYFHAGVTADTIESYAINTATYSLPLDANQLGSTEMLRTGDCKVRSAIYLNGRVHFVFGFDIGQGYCGINYNILDITSKTNTHYTWGLAGTFDYAYPSVASFGVDSTDASVMICFLRSGTSIYPQVCVVNFDGSWSPNSKIVRNGQGPVDISVSNRERWGDKTGICRRFNGLSPGNWLAGQYGAGPSVNPFGVDSSWSTWVAEIGDGHTVGQDGVTEVVSFSIVVYPNPFSGVVTMAFDGYAPKGHSIEIVDLTSRVLFKMKIPYSQEGKPSLSLDNSQMKLAAGTYFVRIHENPRYYEKVVVLD
jgi:Secretion system C-terminal sorting domain